jgi:pyruvate/2-oxoacid:ferredoxin oxidoreductase alpha subunit
MPEKPQPDPVPTDDPPPHPAEPLQIDTPVIHMQDLEHQPRGDTRVSNKGVHIIPKFESTDNRDFAKEDEDALLALEQIEKSLRGQLPG